MKSFFKFMLASMLGVCLLFILSFLVLLVIGLVSGDDTVKIKANTVLKLKLNKPIKEQTPSENPFEDIPIPVPAYLPVSKPNEGTGLNDIKKAIEQAEQDERIKGIYLELSSVNAGFAKLEAIREALIEFKKSGKFLYAYGDFMDEKAYYIASVADKIYVHEQGMIEFNGLAIERTYYTNVFKKIGIQPKIFKVGDFKSAVEPYFRTSMSERDSLQTASFLHELWSNYLKQLSKTLGKDSTSLQEVANKMTISTPKKAEEEGFITKAGYESELEDELRKALGFNPKQKLHFISLSKYTKALKQDKEQTKKTKNRIAVINAEGVITMGKSNDENVGSETIVKAIKQARNSKRTKAIVVRINSPGGNALASDVIWKEIQNTKGVKPIIASMSDYAASGGYYIAMACDTIVARPNTITGSIGIFALLGQAQELLEDKIGLGFSRVKTADLADLAYPTKKYSTAEDTYFQNRVNEGYDNFTRKAAEGRNMTQDQLKTYASGRVWTGSQAKERNLVDVLGGLETAIDIAATSAGLEENDFHIINYPAQKTFIQKLLQQSNTKIKTYTIRQELGVLYPYVKQLKELQSLQGIQARLPYHLDIK